MTEIQTTELKNRPTCPKCSTLLDGVTGRGTPEPGDCTVCCDCEAVLFYKDDMSLREGTPTEIMDAYMESGLGEAIEVVRKVKKKLGRAK